MRPTERQKQQAEAALKRTGFEEHDEREAFIAGYCARAMEDNVELAKARAEVARLTQAMDAIDRGNNGF